MNTPRFEAQAPLDCLVIGGGLLGSAVAYYLAKAGATVRLVERSQLNSAASSQNAGSLHFQLEYRMIENGIAAANKAAEAMPLHLDAQNAWAGLETELGMPVGVVQHGGLMVAETPQQLAVLERKIALEQANGLDVEMLDAAQVQRRAPYLSEQILGAAFCAQEGKADPRRCVLAYAASAARLGARIDSGLGVVALNYESGAWRVQFSDGSECQASTLAITAGAWSGRVAAMAGISLPVSPVALTMTTTMRTQPLITHLIQHAGRRLSLKQTGDGQILIGGGWPARLHHHQGVHDLERRPELLMPSLTGNMSAALAVVPELKRVSILRVWTGTTALVADQLPLLGEVPKSRGLFIATGGSAFTLGPTYARLLAERILGQPATLDITPFDPRRFGSLTLA
ncbi:MULTISPECIES: FAD-binding oxidoreductase [unclassified Serratia (in: enterobacteria)]|uniref:NAD(P)/FAD-dependent oxidoreductase n=1 Tax=unclassified Serratia (in: enterobacteria) TaxID=2647522 RepID=UPI000505BC35|nr:MULTISPECIES: FAD-binding oxidoreductase [unclassified Serratia (in: enterobacteria)]KFK95692.1 FAD-dependent oxidoreductase [Serratia sp. Ag2]KFK95964.1 FAD-dependent oxidoreductase [Serratia sp. Ag1]